MARLRVIMLEHLYDNDESPEVKKLLAEIPKVAKEAFQLKQVAGRADDYARKEWAP